MTANDQVAAATAGKPITQEAVAPPETTHQSAARTTAGNSSRLKDSAAVIPPLVALALKRRPAC